MFGNNSASQILLVDSYLVAGEVLLAEGNLAGSIEALRKGVAEEDRIRYNEPPDWIQPIRHTLGAVLLKAHRYAEAAQVYQRDLKEHPANGWALRGLSDACAALGSPAHAAEYAAKFKEAWKDADVQIGTSCLCVKK
jgi:tetratricopeptide (TPR) repeat protein